MDKNISYQVKEKSVKYPRLELHAGDLVAVVPKERSFDVESFVNEHSSWILKRLQFVEKISLKLDIKLKERSLSELRNEVDLNIIDNLEKLDVNFGNIRFQKMKTKWASCSSKGNLTFNTLLRFLPEDLVSYVVYHEMCHLIHLNHTKEFWNLVKEKYSSPKEYEKKLFRYWFVLKNKIIN